MDNPSAGGPLQIAKVKTYAVGFISVHIGGVLTSTAEEIVNKSPASQTFRVLALRCPAEAVGAWYARAG
jgi:hypothetical protein